jgi:hypothetical protein
VLRGRDEPCFPDSTGGKAYQCALDVAHVGSAEADAAHAATCAANPGNPRTRGVPLAQMTSTEFEGILADQVPTDKARNPNRG